MGPVPAADGRARRPRGSRDSRRPAPSLPCARPRPIGAVADLSGRCPASLIRDACVRRRARPAGRDRPDGSVASGDVREFLLSDGGAIAKYADAQTLLPVDRAASAGRRARRALRHRRPAHGRRARCRHVSPVRHVVDRGRPAPGARRGPGVHFVRRGSPGAAMARSPGRADSNASRRCSPRRSARSGPRGASRPPSTT